MIEHNFKKKYGQNFLIDDNIIRKIVSTANVEKDSLIIEIGPGSGNLTKELDKVAQVITYEIDPELEYFLDGLKLKNTRVIFDDFLKRDIKKDIENYKYKKLYVIANLPYYITTPIINKLISEELNVDKIVIMVQKEVGERFAANTNSKDYSSITVFLNYYFKIKKEFIVSKNSFVPKPNIDSMIISFSKKDTNLIVKNKQEFFKLIRDSFQYKRKNIRNNLKKYDLVKIEEVLKNHDMSLNTRAEEIPLDIFVELSNNL